MGSIILCHQPIFGGRFQSPKQQSYSLSNTYLKWRKLNPIYLRWQKHHDKWSLVLPSQRLFLLYVWLAQERVEAGGSFQHRASVFARRVLSSYTQWCPFKPDQEHFSWGQHLYFITDATSLGSLRACRRSCRWRNHRESSEIWWLDTEKHQMSECNSASQNEGSSAPSLIWDPAA